MSAGGRDNSRRNPGRQASAGGSRKSGTGGSRGTGHGSGTQHHASHASKGNGGTGSRHSSTASGNHRKSSSASAASRRKHSAQRKRRRIAAPLITAAVLILVAAGFVIHGFREAFGPEDYDTSTAEFRRNGSIRVTSVESFDAAYYNSDELDAEIRSSVSDYNNAHGDDSVEEESFSVENGSAKVVLVYQSAEDYQAFNNTTLFMGTVQEAEESGFDFESIMQAVSNEDSTRILTRDTLDQLPDNQAIIMTEQMNVVLPRRWKILYATPNLGVTDFQHASAIDTISDELPAIIILQ